MTIIISKNNQAYGINVEKMVTRMVKYIPDKYKEGLKEIHLLDKDLTNNCFALYNKKAKRIELYISEILEEQPWIIRKLYILPYLSIGMALGHELDHHVNRNNRNIDMEGSAETNSLKYIYPSMGVFKPLVRFLSIFSRKGG